jgi:hypothetical protein
MACSRTIRRTRKHRYLDCHKNNLGPLLNDKGTSA